MAMLVAAVEAEVEVGEVEVEVEVCQLCAQRYRSLHPKEVLVPSCSSHWTLGELPAAGAAVDAKDLRRL